jgi:23S rRNA G2445 N2-methylase RlmL
VFGDGMGCSGADGGGRHQRPSPPQEGAAVDLPLFAALYRDHVQLYRDMSGMSLHRRGYRSAMHRSPLNEAAAAGALLLADWPSLASQGRDLSVPIHLSKLVV